MVGNGYTRLLRPPSSSFFLFGVRGAGKSTWVRAALPDSTHVDLLDEALYHELLAAPGTFAAQLAQLRRGSWVVVDEIQRVPSLLNEVHRLIESRGLRFALLGSSARKLKSAGTNLLAGRARRCQMFPLTPEELGSDFSLEQTLEHGAIPVAWVSDSRAETLESYVQTYLREEIRAEALVRNLPGFLRFVPVAAVLHGQVVNISGVARDAGVARTTVEGYLEILEDTLLTMRLPAYEAKLRVRERRHPKLYWVDPGLVRAARKQLGPVYLDERGPLLEGWILTLLRTYNEIGKIYEEISYWSPSDSKVEVDFLLRRGREFLAIEVKSSARFSSDMLTGLRAIEPLRGLRRRLLLYGGTRRLTSPDGIEIVPVSAFLAMLAERTLWP